MRKFLFFTLTLSSLISVGQDLTEKDFLQENLRGNVKRIVETKYSSLPSYKSNGKTPEATKQIYTVSENNLITKIDEFYSNGENYRTRIATYNGNALIYICQDFPEKSFRILNTYVYNNLNQLTEKKFLNQITYYTYNSLGQLTKETTNYDDQSLKNKTVHKYENNFKISTYKSYDGEIYHVEKTVYDKFNKEIEIVNYLSDEKTISSKVLIQYDNNGNIIKHNPFYNDLIIVTYLYKYDSKGNWIEKTEYRNGIEEERKLRSIEY